MNIEKERLYSLLHAKACSEARYQGFMDRYFFDYKPQSIKFNPKDFWDDSFGLEITNTTIWCIKFLYRMGWGERDYQVRINEILTDNQLEVTNQLKIEPK